jgi:hypothetical protein
LVEDQFLDFLLGHVVAFKEMPFVVLVPKKRPIYSRHAYNGHRTRANLVQYVLWEYVFTQDGIVAGANASQPKTAARAATRKRSAA